MSQGHALSDSVPTDTNLMDTWDLVKDVQGHTGSGFTMMSRRVWVQVYDVTRRVRELVLERG